jgi:hypothetical protein
MPSLSKFICKTPSVTQRPRHAVPTTEAVKARPKARNRRIKERFDTVSDAVFGIQWT